MESTQTPQAFHARFVLSWTAYVRPVAVLLVMLAIGIALYANLHKGVGVVFLLFFIALFAYQILLLRSLFLYTDDHGVWVYSGILPWAKGMNGVKWRDLEDAVFFQNFFSWLFKSYTVRIGHRFTKTSELLLPHIAKGNIAVEHINEMHRQVLSADSVASLA